MPKPTGTPITVTAGQPQRENTRFQVDIGRDAAGNRTYTFSGYAVIRLRDAGLIGNIVWQDPTLIPVVTLVADQIPAVARGWFDQIDTFMDTQ